MHQEVQLIPIDKATQAFQRSHKNNIQREDYSGFDHFSSLTFLCSEGGLMNLLLNCLHKTMQGFVF